MNLLEAPWIPVRADDGAGAFRLLTYRDLLCEPSSIGRSVCRATIWSWLACNCWCA